MSPRRLLPALLFGLPAFAQSPVPVLAVIDGRPGQGVEQVSPAGLSQNVMALTADGRLWSLVGWTKDDGQQPPTVLAAELRLFASVDGGRSWALAAKARTAWAWMGAIGVDPDGTTLHLAWPGRDAAATHPSIYYGVFDPMAMQWQGTADTVVYAAAGASDYYNTPCLAVTSRGLVVVSGTRYPSAYQYSYLKVFDGQAWSPEAKWGTGAAWASVRPHMVLGDDDLIHLAYAGGGYVTYYRSYDPARAAFGGQASFNSGCYHNGLGVTPAGEVFVLHSRSGALYLHHTRTAATPAFTAYEVGKDPLFTNTGPTFYCCRVGVSGSRVAVYYAMPSTKDRILARDWTGSGLGPERTVFLAPPNSEIDALAGMADGFAGHGDLCAWRLKSYDTATPPNLLLTRIMSLVEPAAVARYGRGCQGSNGIEPRLGAADIPFIGNPGFALALDGALGGAAAFACLGASRTAWGGLPLPFDLGPLGFAGCSLRTGIVAALPAMAGPAGTAAAPLPLPAAPALAGAALYAQWLAADAAAPGGLRLSGGGAIRPW